MAALADALARGQDGFGDDHVAGRRGDGLKRLHKSVFRPDGAVLTLVGDFNPDEMADILEEKFGGWKGSVKNKTVPALNEAGPSRVAGSAGMAPTWQGATPRRRPFSLCYPRPPAPPST